MEKITVEENRRIMVEIESLCMNMNDIETNYMNLADRIQPVCKYPDPSLDGKDEEETENMSDVSRLIKEINHRIRVLSEEIRQLCYRVEV